VLATVVSACYAGYDTPKPAPPGADKHILFTDNAEPARGWETRLIGPASTLPPRYRSKGPKACPQFYGVANYSVLWIDASLFTTGKSIESLIALVPPGGVGAFKHRFRDNVLDEAKASAAIKRYAGEYVIEQAARTPSIKGLYETGVIVWRGAQHTMGIRWLAEMLAWSSQDQISFPYAALETGAEITSLPGSSVDNEWFKYQRHTREDW